MKPSKKLRESFERLQAENQEKLRARQTAEQARQDAVEAERREREKRTTPIKRVLALAPLAHFVGSHAHLGSDALTRDWHTAWVDVETDETTGAVMQVQLERVHRIHRDGAIETGDSLSRVYIAVRLSDETHTVTTAPENILICNQQDRTGDDSTYLKDGHGHVAIKELDDDDLAEIDRFIGAIEAIDPQEFWRNDQASQVAAAR